jgi:hypothetical protein
MFYRIINWINIHILMNEKQRNIARIHEIINQLWHQYQIAILNNDYNRENRILSTIDYLNNQLDVLPYVYNNTNELVEYSELLLRTFS